MKTTFSLRTQRLQSVSIRATVKSLSWHVRYHASVLYSSSALSQWQQVRWSSATKIITVDGTEEKSVRVIIGMWRSALTTWVFTIRVRLEGSNGSCNFTSRRFSWRQLHGLRLTKLQPTNIQVETRSKIRGFIVLRLTSPAAPTANELSDVQNLWSDPHVAHTMNQQLI